MFPCQLWAVAVHSSLHSHSRYLPIVSILALLTWERQLALEKSHLHLQNLI